MGAYPKHHHLLSKKIITRAIYCLLPLVFLHLYFFPLPFNQPNLPPKPTSIPNPIPSYQGGGKQRRHPCDYSVGQWVPHPHTPLYNGTTCNTIEDGQNCIAHGRPDSGYLHWRWQPNDCNLNPFNPVAFLRLIQNKHLAFIGDSMARNQLESLLCLLATASPPELTHISGEDSKFRRWAFPTHNATVSVLWSPFLVMGIEKAAASGLTHNELYLDFPDERWSSELDGMDIIVFSVGHWFLHPAIYHVGDRDAVLGCHHCPELNRTEIGFFKVFRKAIKRTLEEVGRKLGESEKNVVVTTFSPAHFEGEWDKAGACPRREPYKGGVKEMEYMDGEMRRIEVEEVAAAAEQVAEKGGRLRVEALDVTGMALMRPDGHPGPYMYSNPFADGVKDRVQNDCVHWCLPGPIDTWNEVLLEMMVRW